MMVGRTKESQKSNIFLCIHHDNLSKQGASVDHEVEIQEDPGDRLSRVHDDTFSGFWKSFDVVFGFFVLFCD